MDLTVLKKMFASNKKEITNAVPVGMKYPIQIEDPKEYNILCFVMLSCAHCIDLLPELVYFNENYIEKFKLYVISHEEEIAQIKEQLEFKFPIFHIDDLEMDNYHIVSTPFLYIIDQNNIVVKATKFKNLNELIAKIDSGRV